ncbi:hypothetical protein QFZ64_002199 [Streptomyces sp. B3I8]|nr:hypothetical protein [Streptomyces sp. B3I8]
MGRGRDRPVCSSVHLPGRHCAGAGRRLVGATVTSRSHSLRLEAATRLLSAAQPRSSLRTPAMAGRQCAYRPVRHSGWLGTASPLGHQRALGDCARRDHPGFRGRRLRLRERLHPAGARLPGRDRAVREARQRTGRRRRRDRVVSNAADVEDAQVTIAPMYDEIQQTSGVTDVRGPSPIVASGTVGSRGEPVGLATLPPTSPHARRRSGGRRRPCCPEAAIPSPAVHLTLSPVAPVEPAHARRDASSITVMSEGAPTRVGGPAAPAPRLT